MPFIVDASVVIKWVVQEAGTPNALALTTHKLLAPDLLVVECADIIRKKVRRGEMTGYEASLATRLLARVDIELTPMRALLEPATRLAIELDHPAQGCTYLALSEARHCEFVTADLSLCRKLAALGRGARVVPLGDIRR